MKMNSYAARPRAAKSTSSDMSDHLRFGASFIGRASWEEEQELLSERWRWTSRWLKPQLALEKTRPNPDNNIKFGLIITQRVGMPAFPGCPGEWERPNRRRNKCIYAVAYARNWPRTLTPLFLALLCSLKNANLQAINIFSLLFN